MRVSRAFVYRSPSPWFDAICCAVGIYCVIMTPADGNTPEWVCWSSRLCKNCWEGRRRAPLAG